MSKQLSSRRLIYEIDTTRLKNNNWSLELDLDTARRNGQIISMFDSEVFRMIRKLRSKDITEEEINKIKFKIKRLQKEKSSSENRIKIKKLTKELDKAIFMPEYVSLVIKRKSDYDTVSKNGFYLNGDKFVELLGSPNGIKKNKVVFIKEKIYSKINSQLNNGRDENVAFVPAKLQAYLSLACSNSTPVTNTPNILVVKDCETIFKARVTKIDDTVETSTGEPLITEEYIEEKKFESSDGQGLIYPKMLMKWQEDLRLDYLPSGVCIRNAFTKGMLFPFDFRKFARDIAKKQTVKDVWGKEHDINNIDIVLTTSMLKLWNCYKSINHFLECCKKNGFGFSVTKVTPQTLENERRLNYQFIQALSLNKDDINDLVNPTIYELKEVLGMGYEKTILFLGGEAMGRKFTPTIEDKIVSGLMLDARVINDGYVKTSIHKMVKKKIDETKYGKIKVQGNFQIIADDPYTLCESMFGLEPKGLLKANEFYSNYWNKLNVNEVAAFRAPMSCQSNARKFKLVVNDDMKKWYKNMENVFILNSWDTTCDALNGADKDGDMIFTTNNKVILKGVLELDSIMCVQKNAPKKRVTKVDMRKANKKGFGNDVGGITNKVTSMYERIAMFDKESEEYKTLKYRIQCGQNYQQNSIDKCKGIVAKDMPKYWYDYKEAKAKDEQIGGDFNQRIVANKKPYFMCYIYPSLMSNYKNFITNTNKNCLMRFGIDVNTLIAKENKTDEEKEYLEYYNNKMPVGMSKCIMNEIAWKVENEFSDIRSNLKDDNFDKRVYMSNVEISNSHKKKVKALLEKYQKIVVQFVKKANREKIDKEEKKDKFDEFINSFQREALTICNNREDLCNTLVAACYDNVNSRAFIWNVVGEQILENLIKNNNSIIYYPYMNDEGDIEFNGEKYSFDYRKLREEEVNEVNS